MTKFEVTMLFVVFLNTIVIAAFSKSADTAMFQQTSDQILNILDDLFIVLKIDQNFSKSKNVEEYMSRHSLVQDALRNNHKKYKEIHDISKTNISHKIAYYISNINEVVHELIRTENVTKPANVLNDINSTLDESQQLVNLARRFNLNNKTIATTTPKLPTTKGSQDEARRIFEGKDSDSILGDSQNFVNLARRFNSNIKAIATAIPTRLPSTNDSQDEVRRIFEGSSTGIKKYPFMVSVHVSGRFVCAGSLVHKSLALSAASCLMASTAINADIQIRVASDYVSKMGYLVNIQETIFHPEFDRTTLANNLVILRTRKALGFRQQSIVAIEYDRAAVSALTPNVQDVVILGWGRRKAIGTDLLEKDRPLSKAHLQLYDFSDCKYIYTRNFVGDKTFCAGFVDRGAGACNHDAGGPALIANILVGVISFGSPKCGATEAPTVFTRVGVYDIWIDSILQKLDQNPEISLNQPTNISKDIARTEIMNLDKELKDVYKENFVPDEVLNGPIEALDDNEMPNISHKFNLQEFSSDPSVFPNPELLASNTPKSETVNSAEITDGYWKDYTIEETQESDDYYTPATDLVTARTVATIATNQQDNKAHQVHGTKDNVKFVKYVSPKEASLDGNYFDNKQNDIKTNSRKNKRVEFALIIKESNKKRPKTSTVSVLRENPNGYVIDGGEQTELMGISEKQQFQMKQPTGDEIEKTEINERAIIVLVDSGTTQRIELHNKDPIYQRGFKILADRVRQSQGLV